MKTKEELINEIESLNKEFISKIGIGKESVVEISVRMCEIEDELYEKYGITLDVLD